MTLSAVTLRGHAVYLAVQICFEDKLTDAFFKAVVHHALHSAFGLVGGGIHVDLLVFDSDSQSAVLRVDKDYAVILRSSLTMLTEWTERPCRVSVLKASPHLPALAIDAL